MKPIYASSLVLGAALLVAKPSAAEPPPSVNDQVTELERQIELLREQSQQQIDVLQRQVRALEAQVKGKPGGVAKPKKLVAQAADPPPVAPAPVAQAAPAPSPRPPAPATAPPLPTPSLPPVAASTTEAAPRVTLYPAKGPAFTTPDGLTTIQLAARLQFDVGDYFNVTPQSRFSSPQTLNSGVNARRARLGLVGTFYGDWNYALIYDFGGSADSLTNSGGNTSGIENAYVTYTGLKNVAFDVGYQNVPWTLDEATISTDILFLERASPSIVATNIAAGDFRSAADVRFINDRYFGGLWLTGPVSGQPHNTGEQFGALARFSYQILQTPDYTLHLGADVETLLKAPSSSGVTALTLSDRPELRLDPTVVLNTGQLAAIGHANVFGGELAANYKNLFLQSEYYHFAIDRTGLPSLGFDGGYVETSWVLTGEQHKYVTASGAYSGILPDDPLSLTGRGWGAFELAARYSIIDLDDRVVSGRSATATGAVAGGLQRVYTLGANWYPDTYVRFSLNYLFGSVDKVSVSTATAPLGTPVGLKFNAVALRSQVAF